MVNYEIDPAILEEFLPVGTELDLWNGKCYVSVVGFMFLNTRLLGIKVPFHSEFEEVNLRFYVRRRENDEWKRGVVFIKEIVPKFALALVANIAYKENYESLKMDHTWQFSKESIKVGYRWKKKGKWNNIQVSAKSKKVEIEVGSVDEFITEHYWGYAKVNTRHSNEYEVTHPKWKTYPVTEVTIDIDFAENYGKVFQFLSEVEPSSVMLAEGSEITVEPKRKIFKKDINSKNPYPAS